MDILFSFIKMRNYIINVDYTKNGQKQIKYKDVKNNSLKELIYNLKMSPKFKIKRFIKNKLGKRNYQVFQVKSKNL